MILVRPTGTILPAADATMSTLPIAAQASAVQATAMMVAPIARPTGDGGFSTISSAAGRKSISSAARRSAEAGNGTIFLADFMESRLQPVQCGIAPAGSHQIVVSAVL